MEYRILGKTGLKISRMGLGGIPIQRIDAEGTKKLMYQLMEAGVNFVDSARGYSVSEEYLGYALEGIRDKFVLATKSMARTKEEMARDVDISLKNFRTDYIDLYQFHNPNEAQLDQLLGEGGAMEALQEAKAAGKIGHIGITLHSAKLFERVFASYGRFEIRAVLGDRRFAVGQSALKVNGNKILVLEERERIAEKSFNIAFNKKLCNVRTLRAKISKK